MRIDGLTLSEGSTIKNLSVDTGTVFPSLPNSGEMFYRTDGGNLGLYVYNGSSWAGIAAGVAVGSVTSVSVTTANGVSGSVVNATTTPAISISLGAITPSSINTAGSVTASSFIGSGASLTGITSAAALTTPRTISTTGDGVMSVSFDGSANVSSGLVFATVNSSPQTDAFRKVSINGKGLVTASSAVVAGDITTALGYNPVNKAGDTLTGALILNADPTAALGAVTKQYVDNISTGLNAHPAVATATTAALPACTYANGTAGVGATLTGNVAGALGAVGGYASLVANDRVLVKNQATTAHNGLYVVSFIGDGVTQFVLTRAPEFDNTPNGEIAAGDFVYVQNGTLVGTQWVQTTAGTLTVGTSPIVFSQLSGAGVVTGGTGISVASNVVTNTGVVSLVAGTNIAISGSTGNVTVNVSGTVPSAVTATTAGTVTTAAQTNITSLGTLTGLTLSGDITQTSASARTTYTNATTSGNGGLQNNNASNYVLLYPSTHTTKPSHLDLSSNTALNLLISGTTIAALSSTGVVVAGKGTFGTGTPLGAVGVDVSRSTGSCDVGIYANDNASGTANAQLRLYSGGATGGDPIVNWEVNGGLRYYMGIDNSNADKLVIGSGYIPGVADILTIGATGLAVTGALSATGNITTGNGTGTPLVIANGGSSGVAAGGGLFAQNGGVTIAAIGGYSAIMGGAYDNTATVYSSNSLRLMTNGSTKATIDTSGNLGIGTASPSSTLDVASASSDAVASFTATGVQRWQLKTERSTGNFLLYNQTALTTPMTLSASGNLGLGVTPTYQLDVRSTLTGTTAGSNRIANLSANASGRDAYLAFGDNVNANAGMGYLSGALYWYANGAERMRLDTSGNVGLGVTPSAWSGYEKAIQGRSWAISAPGVDSMDFLCNAYYNGGYKYQNSYGATMYGSRNGSHVWFSAPAGTAGNPISFTQPMTLSSTGLSVTGAVTAASFTGAHNGTVGATTPSTGAFTTLSASGVGAALNLSGATTSSRRVDISTTGANINIGAESSGGGAIIAGASPYALALNTGNAAPVQVGVNSALVGTFSSTGLAVTGALSASGNGDFNTGSSGRVRSGTPTFGGQLEALGGGSGAIISITPNTISGANGVDYTTSFVSGGNGPHNFKIGSTTHAVVSSTGLAVTGGISCIPSGGGRAFSTAAGSTKVKLASFDAAWASTYGFEAASSSLSLSQFGAYGATKDTSDYSFVAAQGQDYSTPTLKVFPSAVTVTGGLSATGNILTTDAFSYTWGASGSYIQGSTAGKYINSIVPSGGTSNVTIGGTAITTTSSTGLSVTGVLSTTGSTSFGTTGPSVNTFGASASYGELRSGGSGATIYLNGASRGGPSATSTASGAMVHATDEVILFTNSLVNVEKMRIAANGDLSVTGNVGIGVTPSAWGGGRKAIELSSLSHIVSSGTSLEIGTNYYFNGTNYIYKVSNTATLYTSSNGAHSWYTAPSGTAGNPISFTQAMTLDANGVLSINGGASWAPAQNGISLSVSGNDKFVTSYYDASSVTIGAGISTKTGIQIFGQTHASGNKIVHRVGNTDAMTLNSSGLSVTGAVTAASFTGAHNGTVGATTPSTGAFTTLSASGAATISNNLLLGATGIADGAAIFRRSSDGVTVGSLSADSANSQIKLASGYDKINFYGSAASFGTWTPTGLSVTGALSATGNLTATSITPSSQTLTDGATISWNCSLGQNATVTLAGNRTVAAPTNQTASTFYMLEVIQDATGSRTLAWNSIFKFANATAPTLSTTPLAHDYFCFESDGTNMREVGRSQGVI